MSQILQMLDEEIANADKYRDLYLNELTAASYDNHVQAITERFNAYKYHQTRYEVLTLFRDKIVHIKD